MERTRDISGTAHKRLEDSGKMKRAATIGLAMTLVTLNATLFSSPAMADGLLSDLVKDTLGTAGAVVNGVVGGAAGVVGGATGLATGAVAGTVNALTGTVDATGNVIDTTGNVIGRVIVSPTTTTVVPGWTVVSPSTTTMTTTAVPATTTTTRIFTFGSAPTVYGATLDTRISDLRSAINAAESGGKLTAQQASDLRAELDRIATAYSTTKATNTLTFEGALRVARDLDSFNSRLSTTLALQPFTPLIVTTGGTERLIVSSAVIPGASTAFTSTVPGTVVSTLPGALGTVVNSSGNLVGNMLNGVGNAVGGTVGTLISAAGGLVGGTVNTVGNTVNTVTGNLINGTVTTTGEVIDASGRVIGTVIPGAIDATLTTSSPTSSRLIIGTTTSVLGTNIDLRMADMRRLLSDYTLSGRLSAAQAADLTMTLDRIASNLASERASGGTLTFDEAINIARDLDAASGKFGTYIGTNPFQPMVLVQSGNPAMMIITRNGVVSAMPGTGSTVISGTIPTSPVSILPILDVRRLELDRLISNALANHTITASDAAKFETDLNRIGAQIVDARGLGSQYTIDQTITLARTLDDLNTRLATAMNVAPLTALTIAGPSGLPTLSTTMFNGLTGLTAVDANIWVNTFSNRRAELEAMIASGLSAGTLTAQQAAELRGELTRIANLEAAARTASGGFTYVNALPIAMSYDVLGNRIHTFVANTQFVPLVAQDRITFTGGTVALIDEVSLRRAQVSASIDRELALGRLTPAEASRLRIELGNVIAREQRMRADGFLTWHEATQLTTDLTRIANRINQMIANRRATVSVLAP